jgi:methylenetetrahydrofolate dehydrogenase (NADP+)/methenyltetrahydrofolate cyclohydrolase
MKEARGRLLAERIISELRPRAARFQELAGRPAAMSALAADDVTSRRFVQLKQERFKAGGLQLRASFLDVDSTTDDAVLLLGTLNGDASVDSIFLQFPLPAGVAAQAAADAIAPAKDADAAGSARLGQVLAGTEASPPATPAAVLLLLEDELQELSGRTVVLVGTMGLTERCLAMPSSSPRTSRPARRCAMPATARC